MHMNAKQYKQQLQQKWDTIKDPYAQSLIAQLLAYAEQLEKAKTPLQSPNNPSYTVGPKGDGEGSQSFRAALEGATPDGEAGRLLEALLGYTETLEQNLSPNHDTPEQ